MTAGSFSRTAAGNRAYAWSTNFNVICATQSMSGTQPNTYTKGEHKHSATGRHLEDHGLSKSDLKEKKFSVSRKCRKKFDCLIFGMLFIKELKPGLIPRRSPFVQNYLRDTACKYFSH